MDDIIKLINSVNESLTKDIENTINNNIVSEDGCTILHNSAESGWAITCDMLANSGMDINSKNNKDQSPLDIACIKGEYDVAKVLLHHNAEINNNTLIYAISSRSYDIVELLLHNGANPNITHNKYTPLLIAGLSNCYKTIKLLIENGADLNYVNEDEVCILQCLIRGLMLGKGKLHEVKKIIEYLGTVEINVSNNVLFDLIACGDFDLFSYFINKGIDVNVIYKEKNALFYCNDYSIDMAEILISKGININYNNLLMYHISGQNVEMVQLLLQNNVNTDIIYEGHNPCELAISYINNRIVKLLLENNCKPKLSFVKTYLTALINSVKIIELKTPMKLSSTGEMMSTIPVIPSSIAKIINTLISLCTDTEGMSEDIIQKIQNMTLFTCYYE